MAHCKNMVALNVMHFSYALPGKHYTAQMVKVLANLRCLFYTSNRHKEVLAFIGLI